MKYSSSQGGVLEIDPSIQTGKFGIDINEKTFSVLVGTIYNNKIRAIVRELSCNAFDSHTEAKNPNPIEIHLPTQSEPFFYVQDNGIGLNEEDIVNIYTVFFASTKDKTNKYIGSLGIGAKVFFSYNTKSATITSVKNGTKYVYSCYIDNGVPAYAKLLEEKTSDVNGVKVELPVKSSDFYAFEHESKQVFQWFNRKPKFIGKQVSIPEATKLIEGKGWYYSKNVSSSILTMGNIGYEIEIGEANLNKYKNFINSGFVIDARLGEAEFSASREGLSYTHKTVAYLQKRFSDINSEIQSKIEEKLKNSKNYYEACVNYSKIEKELPWEIKTAININPSYNGTKLQKYFDIKIEGVNISHYRYDRYRTNPKKYYNDTINCEESHVLVVNDMVRGQHQNSIQYVKDNSVSVYLIDFNTNEHPDCKKSFFESLGCDESNTILSSSLPKVTTVKASRKSNANKVTSLMKYTHDRYSTKCWADVNLDITKNKGVYVLRKGYQYLDKSKNEYSSSSNLSYILNKFNFNDEVYAIPPKEEKELINNGWIELQDALKKHISKNVEKLVEEAAQREPLYNIGFSNIRNLEKIPGLNHLYKEYLNISSKKYGSINRDELIKLGYKDLIEKKEKELKEKFEKLKKELKELKKDYPMLDCHWYHVSEIIYYYEGKKNAISSKNGN